MKIRFNPFLRSALAAALSLGGTSANAATYDWNGSTRNSNSTWGTSTNWSSGSVAATGVTAGHRLNIDGTGASNAGATYTSAQGTTVYGSNTVRGLTIGATNNGILTITGGSFSTLNSNNATVSSAVDVLGNASGRTGTLNVSGGTFIGSVRGTYLGFGSGGNGVLNMNSGLATITSLVYNSIGTTNLTGGILEVNSVSKTGGTGDFNFNGGTLRARTSTTTFMTGLTNATVQSGHAKIDTNNNTITIGQALLNGGGGGGLEKSGSGTLTLSSGSNTYTGATTIKAGTLKINTSTTISTSSSIVAGDTGSSGAVLDATTAGLTVGTAQTLAGIGKVLATGQTLTASGTISPGDSSIGTLTIDGGSLTLDSTSKFAFTLGSTGSSDLVSLLNSVTLSGNSTLDFLDFNFTAGTGFGIGVYTLFDNAGSISNLLNSSGLSGTIGGLNATLSTSTFSGNDLILTVIPEPSSALLGGLGVLTLLRRRRI